jgi:hypothetical protein
MQPYVIRQGDFLAKLAHRFGFDADTVWNDPANTKLGDARTDPNILAPTDILYIPDGAGSSPPAQELTTGTTNTFVSEPPSVTVSVKFADTDGQSYSSRAFTIAELEDLTGLTTDGDGVAAFQAPVTLSMATLTFTDSNETWTLRIGSLDPINTPSGIFQRLQHLGYIPLGAELDGDDLTVLNRALYYFKSQGTPPPADSSNDDDSDDDDGGGTTDRGGSPDSGTDSDDSDDDDDDSVNLSFADDLWCPDDCGISDDGTLPPDLEASLLHQHGG